MRVQAFAFGPRGCSRLRLERLRPDLDPDLWVSDEVPVPIGVLWSAAFGGHHDIVLAVLAVEQREDVLLARFPAGCRQQQRRDVHFRVARWSHRIDVSLFAVAGNVAVRMVDHPLREVRSKLSFGHSFVSF